MDDITAVNDPHTSPTLLADIAARRPDLWPAIDAHPAAYPGLREWIAASRAARPPLPAVSAADAAAMSAVSAPGPTAVPAHLAETVPLDPFVPASSAPTPRRRKGLIIGLIAGASALVLATGGGIIAWNVLTAQAAGAATPSAAAERLFTGVIGVDLMRVAGSISPAEAQIVLPSLEALNELGEESDVETTEALADLAAALEVTVTEELVWDEHEIAEGVTRVTLTAGAVEVDGDPEAIADAVMRFAEPLARAYGDASGLSDGDFDRQLAEMRDELIAEIELPQTVTVDDIRDETDTDPYVVAVQENNAWYVSPVLTSAEYALMQQSGADALERSDVPGPTIDGARFDSPEAAIDGVNEGLEEFALTGAIEKYAAALPLAERRLVSLYASSFADAAGTPAMTAFDITGDVAVERDGARALLLPDGLTFAWTTLAEYTDVDLSGELTITGHCWEGFTESPIDYGFAQEPAPGSDQVAKQESAGCLDRETTGLDFALLGVEEWRGVAIEENGSWFVSPYASTGYTLGVLVEHLVELIQDEELDRLWGG